MPGPVVDTSTAQELMGQITEQISVPELSVIAGDLEQKSALFQETLATPGGLDRDSLRRVLRQVFATRRKADQILDVVTPAKLGGAVEELLHSEDALTERFARFDQVLAEFPEQGFDLPGELLHFTFPDTYWLWTRWVWDPRSETGALPLVVTEDVDLVGAESRGAAYVTVGQALAFVDETGKAAGFTAVGRGLFGADVFLAAVYGVYMYTILRMRMTQEFNRVVPPLPDLVRRLLGVYHMEA